ncbi:hypothetical protein MD484_g595, partial [Candolleomyces efflorescens]
MGNPEDIDPELRDSLRKLFLCDDETRKNLVLKKTIEELGGEDRDTFYLMKARYESGSPQDRMFQWQVDVKRSELEGKGYPFTALDNKAEFTRLVEHMTLCRAVQIVAHQQGMTSRQLNARIRRGAAEGCTEEEINADNALWFNVMDAYLVLHMDGYPYNGIKGGIGEGWKGEISMEGESSVDIFGEVGEYPRQKCLGNFELVHTESSVMLKGELGNGNHEYVNAEVNLAICIVNHGGRLVFVKHDGLFDRDGFFAKLLEPLPVIGLVIGGVHALAGNLDHAARAIARSVNSTIVLGGMAAGILAGALAAGTVIGALFANPIVGCVIGAGLASSFGVLAEVAIADRFIVDPRVRADIEEATIGRCIFETLRNMVAAAGAGLLAQWLGGVLASKIGIDATVKALQAALVKYGFTIPLDFALYGALKKVIDLLRGIPVPEWVKASQDFDDIKSKHPSHFPHRVVF